MCIQIINVYLSMIPLHTCYIRSHSTTDVQFSSQLYQETSQPHKMLAEMYCKEHAVMHNV